jgi:hypothetical protein
MTAPGDDDRPMRVSGGVQTAEVRVTTGRAWKLTAPLPDEVDLQAAGEAAFATLIRPPAEFTAFPAGHLKLTGAQAARLTRIGLKRSWPDHLVLYAGKLIGIEWKKPGEALSRSRWVRTKSGRSRWVEGQREVFPRLAGQGMRGPYVCETVEQALEALEAEGVPMVRWRIAA